jgi:acetylornithine deacetylase/succinyl-diaminopimelate desuccinylase-like protein
MYLVAALASLRDLDMNIKIDGFYDGVVKPTDADRQMMARIDPEVDERKKLVGFDRLMRNPKPEHVIEQLLFTPTCNVAGVTTGYQGPGSKTVLPAEATAKLDFRLIPNQDPAHILDRLRRHLDSHAFEKVEIVSSDGEKPARSDPDSEVAKSVIGCVRDLLGEPVLWPFMQATGRRGPWHPDSPAGRGGPAGQPDPRPQREHPRRGLHQYRPVDVPGLGTVRGRIDQVRT